MPGKKKTRRPYKDREYARTEKQLRGALSMGLDFEKVKGGFRVVERPGGRYDAGEDGPAAGKTDERGGHPDSDAQDARFGQQ